MKYCSIHDASIHTMAIETPGLTIEERLGILERVHDEDLKLRWQAKVVIQFSESK